MLTLKEKEVINKNYIVFSDLIKVTRINNQMYDSFVSFSQYFYFLSILLDVIC